MTGSGLWRARRRRTAGVVDILEWHKGKRTLMMGSEEGGLPQDLKVQRRGLRKWGQELGKSSFAPSNFSLCTQNGGMKPCVTITQLQHSTVALFHLLPPHPHPFCSSGMFKSGCQASYDFTHSNFSNPFRGVFECRRPCRRLR